MKEIASYTPADVIRAREILTDLFLKHDKMTCETTGEVLIPSNEPCPPLCEPVSPGDSGMDVKPKVQKIPL